MNPGDMRIPPHSPKSKPLWLVKLKERQAKRDKWKRFWEEVKYWEDVFKVQRPVYRVEL